MGQAISLRVQSLRAQARKVVKQIETPCSPDPILRRPCADREEKRVTRESDTIRKRSDQEQLDPKTPIREDYHIFYGNQPYLDYPRLLRHRLPLSQRGQCLGTAVLHLN
jgi:hypothetical protein